MIDRWTFLAHLVFSFLISTTFSDSCPLFWSSRQNLGFGQGVQLQVCCNVSRVKIWKFDDASTMKVNPQVAFEKEFPDSDDKDDVWSDLQLSICSDRSEPTIGWVGARPGVTCEYRRGQTVIVPTSAVTLPGWYIICYVMTDGCQTCSIEILCENDFTEACSDLHILGSSPSATNTSIRYWVKVGNKFPFQGSSRVDMEIKNQRTGQYIYTHTVNPKPSVKSNLTFNELAPHEVYNIRRCLLTTIPQSLFNDVRFDFSSSTNKTNRLCVEEGFRTLRNGCTSFMSFFLFSYFLLIFS